MKISILISVIGMTYRQCAQYATIMSNSSSVYDYYIGENSGELGNAFLKGILLPYVAGLRIVNKKAYYDFVCGGYEDDFIGYLKTQKEVLMELRIEADYIENFGKKIYDFIVHIMNSDGIHVEPPNIHRLRFYEDSVTLVFKCLNFMYDFEVIKEDEKLID